MSFGLYLNSLHLSFNLGILGTRLSRGILICHVLECSSTKAGSWMTKLEYAHRNKWEIQERFSALQTKLYHTAAILRHCCSHMAPRGTMAGCNRSLRRQSWVEVRTWAGKGMLEVHNTAQWAGQWLWGADLLFFHINSSLPYTTAHLSSAWPGGFIPQCALPSDGLCSAWKPEPRAGLAAFIPFMPSSCLLLQQVVIYGASSQHISWSVVTCACTWPCEVAVVSHCIKYEVA